VQGEDIESAKLQLIESYKEARNGFSGKSIKVLTACKQEERNQLKPQSYQ